MTKDEADAMLRNAILEHTRAYGMHDNEWLSEFAIVACWSTLDDDGKTRYTTHYHSPEIPHHVAVGLFTTGLSCAVSEEAG